MRIADIYNIINRNKYAWWGITTVLAAVYAAMYYLHPHCYDECWYKDSMLSYVFAPTPRHFCESVWRCWVDHYESDNCRLANIIGAPLLLMPKWLSSALLGAAVGYSTMCAARLAGIWRRNLTAYFTLLFLWVIALPWNDVMLSTIFGMNYTMGIAVTLAAMAVFINSTKCSLAAACAIALVAGAWHEGFSAPLLCGLLTMAVFYRRYRTKRHIAIIIAIAIGITVICLAPGPWLRAHQMNNLGYFLKHPFAGAYYGAICYIAAGLYIISCRRISHKRAAIPLGLFTSMIAAWVVWRIFYGLPRTIYVCTAFAIVLLTALLWGRYKIGLRILHFPSAARMAFCISITAIIAMHFGACIAELTNLKRCDDIQRRDYPSAAHIGSNIYIPLRMPWDISLMTLGRVTYFNYMRPGVSEHIYSVNTGGGKLTDINAAPYITPEALRGFTPERATRYECNTPAYLYHGVIVLAYSDAHVYGIEATFGNAKCNYYYVIRPFTGADGQRYLYIVPQGGFKEALLYRRVPDAIRLNYNPPR